MPEKKSSRSNANTLGGHYRSIDLKKVLKALEEKPQEEFDRLREALENTPVGYYMDPEY